MKVIQAGRVRFTRIAMVAVLAGLLPAGIAPAAAAVDPGAARAACTSDAFRLCSNAMPDVGRTKACLLQHRGSLSPACRAGLSGGGGGGGTHRHKEMHKEVHKEMHHHYHHHR
jgi:hypothetical protein